MPQIDINIIINIAKEAGDAIMAIYQQVDSSLEIDYKADNSPLTNADKASHNYIVKELAEFYPDIPILSEEGDSITHEQRKSWSHYWLIDPLDGTKEFINRNGEFTVNIALIENNKPTLGVVYIPVQDKTYYGEVGKKAYLIEGKKTSKEINSSKKTTSLKAVKSRSHASDVEEHILSKLDIQDAVACGSSIKLCLIAEGKAEVYLRYNPTSEWDTAAGDAVIKAAGGETFHLLSKDTLPYNKENILNESFICLGNPDLIKDIVLPK